MRSGFSLLLLFTTFFVQALQMPAGGSLDERGVWRIDGAELQLTFAMDNWKWINNAQWSAPKSVTSDRRRSFSGAIQNSVFIHGYQDTTSQYCVSIEQQAGKI